MADSDDDLAASNELPRVRSDASVDVELGLCQALGTWDPWVTPTEHIVDNLRAVKASETSSSDDDPIPALMLGALPIVADGWPLPIVATLIE